jgi:prepilin peptidase CpaA
MPVPIVLAVLAFIAVCMAMDVRTRRIPNLLSGPAILLGLALNTFYFGLAGLGASLGGALLALALLLFPFALGGIGGGDVKMMTAVGALLGPDRAILGLAIGILLGGVIMVVHLAWLGRLREKMAVIGAMVAMAALTRSVSPLRLSAGDATAVSLPYSVPLGLGALLVLAAGGPLGF